MIDDVFAATSTVVAEGTWDDLDPALKGLVIMLAIILLMLLIGAIRNRF
jgi:hypothetical protein